MQKTRLSVVAHLRAAEFTRLDPVEKKKRLRDKKQEGRLFRSIHHILQNLFSSTAVYLTALWSNNGNNIKKNFKIALYSNIYTVVSLTVRGQEKAILSY